MPEAIKIWYVTLSRVLALCQYQVWVLPKTKWLYADIAWLTVIELDFYNFQNPKCPIWSNLILFVFRLINLMIENCWRNVCIYWTPKSQYMYPIYVYWNNFNGYFTSVKNKATLGAISFKGLIISLSCLWSYVYI